MGYWVERPGGLFCMPQCFVGGEKFEAATENAQLEVAFVRVPKTFGCTMRSAQAAVRLAGASKARTGHHHLWSPAVATTGRVPAAGEASEVVYRSKPPRTSHQRSRTKLDASNSQLP